MGVIVIYKVNEIPYFLIFEFFTISWSNPVPYNYSIYLRIEVAEEQLLLATAKMVYLSIETDELLYITS